MEKKCSKKFVWERKRVLYLRPRSGHESVEERKSSGGFIGFSEVLKKYFNFFSKNIVGKKKSNYICTRLRDKRLERIKKSS